MFNFAQKELATKAYEIDKKNEFPDLRVSRCTLVFVDILFFLVSNVCWVIFLSVMSYDISVSRHSGVSLVNWEVLVQQSPLNMGVQSLDTCLTLL